LWGLWELYPQPPQPTSVTPLRFCITVSQWRWWLACQGRVCLLPAFQRRACQPWARATVCELACESALPLGHWWRLGHWWQSPAALVTAPGTGTLWDSRQAWQQWGSHQAAWCQGRRMRSEPRSRSPSKLPAVGVNKAFAYNILQDLSSWTTHEQAGDWPAVSPGQ
jgi:hypothetical protein